MEFQRQLLMDRVRLMNTQDLKICYVGGASRYWAKMVATDLALTPELKGEIALYDINFEAAKENAERLKRLFDDPEAKTRFKVKAYKQRKVALRGADFVFMSILPGPMQMMANDLDIPAKYGVLQTVGDTTGPGGISRMLRTIPIYLEYADLIMDHCPNAWVINYTNPMTLCTAALYAAQPRIKAIGCCHEVFGTQDKIARIVSEMRGIEKPKRQEIKLDIAGVNHFTMATAARFKGEDLFPLIREWLETSDVWNDHTKWSLKQAREGLFFGGKNRVAWDFFKRFGVVGAAGDRHLVEFVPWYLNSEKNLHRNGVVRTPSSFRLGTWKPAGNAPGAKSALSKENEGLVRSGEEAVDMILALSGVRDLDTNVNIPNVGQMPQFENGFVVETNAQFRYDSLTPIVARPLPLAVKGLMDNVVTTQKLTLEAGMKEDRELALQAMLSDPLVNLPIDEAEQMMDELFEANREMMPEGLLKS